LLQAAPTPDVKLVLMDHGYAAAVPCVEPEVIHEPPVQLEDNSVELLLEAREKLLLGLPPYWVPFVDKNGVHVMLLSRQDKKAVQRSLYCLPSGRVELSVHCRPMLIDPYLEGVCDSVILKSDTVGEFCDRIIAIVAKVRLMEICAGVDNAAYREVWSSVDLGEIDKNPYQECRYTETFHSLTCQLLVHSGKWRCKECTLLVPFMRRRHEQ